MYLHCKAGFVEADRWDGSPIPLATHQRAVRRLLVADRKGGCKVIVMRSREEATLVQLVRGVGRKVKVYESPVGWDYEWRAYVTDAEFGTILYHVVAGLDYRNFKSWTTKWAPDQHGLALDIWHAAHAAGERSKRR
jgi:hypothetical protein